MRNVRSICAISFAAAFLLAGCGTYVPEIQEFPADSVAGQAFVRAIVHNVTCEVADAVDDVYKRYPSNYLDNWGAQITLNLQVAENGSLNPTVNWMPPSPATALFNLAGGVNLSSEATRIDILNSYYTVQQLREMGRCHKRPDGPFLLHNDLKLNEWLYDALTAERTLDVNFPKTTKDPGKTADVISHQVKFVIVSDGNVTPTWKLTNVSINPTGKFLSVGRTRTHSLLVTFGPASSQLITAKVHGKMRQVSVAAPSTQAAYSHLSSEIGLAVSNGVRSALAP